MSRRVVSGVSGLSTQEVLERAARGLVHAPPERSSRSYWQIFKTNIFSLYNLVLFLSLLVLLILRQAGDVSFAAALMFINAGVGLFQELRAKRALDHLAALTQRTTQVVRDGKKQTIPISEVVQDDVIVLEPGQPIIADGPVLVSEGLEIDESFLTGESEYIPKLVGDELTSGSYCAAGSGLMCAAHVGQQSAVHKLTLIAKAYKSSQTPLEKWIALALKLLVGVMVVLAPLTFVAGNTQGLAVGESIANMVNIISSLVPQGLILSITISFAFGAINIARRQALIQRLNAIESMGHVTVVCTDKTGTLTKNHLKVTSIVPLANNPLTMVKELLRQFSQTLSFQNRTLLAIAEYAKEEGSKTTSMKSHSEVPFNSQRKWSAVSFAKGETYLLGAPEVLVNDGKILQQVQELSKQGLRVILFAKTSGEVSAQAEPRALRLEPLGLITMVDEVRADVAQTLADFAKLGIKVKVISGDSAETVQAIAQQAQMTQASSKVMTEMQLAGLPRAQFEKTVRTTTLFARISPEMKRKIIATLTKQGEYVAMVGDGVNDVPALKQARIAIVMNDGTQIAKDVSDIVLLNNAFSSLPAAMNEGRRITQSLYAVTKIFFVKIIYLTVLFVLTGFAALPFALNLRQSTWIAFMTVGIPTLLLAFRILQPYKYEKSPRAIVQFSLLAGCIGGLAMTILTILAITFKDGNELLFSRTLISLYACMYGSIVLWMVQGWPVSSIFKSTQVFSQTLLILVLAAISIAMPVWIAPYLFRFVSLSAWHISGLLLVLLLSVLTLNYATKNLHVPKIVRSLIDEDKRS